MAMLTNKHTLIAMLVAPLLAVGAYYAMDAWVGEKPHAAVAGNSYPLVEMPNCRYDSGKCGLKNNDVRLDLTVEWLSHDRFTLTLRSEIPLQGAKVAVSTEPPSKPRPFDMAPAAADNRIWTVELASDDPAHHRLHVVASADDTLYFGDASLVFSTSDPDKETW